MSVITFADVQEIYGYVATEETNVQKFIDGVETEFEKTAGVGLTQIERTEYIDGLGNNKIPLQYLPIITITSIFIDNTREFSADTEYTDFKFTDDAQGNILLPNGYVIPILEKNIKVVYTGGLSTIPADLLLMMMEHIDYLYQRDTNHRQGVKNMNSNGVNTDFIMTTPLLILKKYQSYKRFHF